MNKILANTFLLLLSVVSLYCQTQTISGTVTNSKGTPLSEVAILIENTLEGTTSNEKGRWSIKMDSDPAALVFSALGFKSQRVIIGDKLEIDVVLIEEFTQLQEAVVIGFGLRKKSRVTGAISSIGDAAIQNVSVPTFQRALQGRIPGVVITNASGGLNAEANIRIRGVGSINAGNQPLFVVDGLILAAEPGGLLGYSTNPYLGVDPNTIESVEVLKDAAATAIYGSRGANGVILITTKSGRFNTKPKVNIGSYAGFSEVSKKYDLLDGKEYAAMWNTAATNSGGVAAPLYVVASQPTIDWQSLLLRKGFVQETTANVSGGTEGTRYYIGGTFRKEDSYLNTIGLERYSILTKVEQKLGAKWTTGLSFNVSQTIDSRTGNLYAGSAWGAAGWFVPNLNVLDENGDYIEGGYITSNGFLALGATNPYTLLEDQWVGANNTMVLVNAHLSWSPLKNFKIKSQLGTELSQEMQHTRLGSNTWFGRPSGRGYANSRQMFNYNWATLANWQKRWKQKHDFLFEGGIQISKESYQGVWSEGEGFTGESLVYLNSAAKTNGGSWKTQAAFVGVFGRINYAFVDRFYLTLSSRYDGSSRFGVHNRYGFFPSFSVGWRLSEEGFFTIDKIDFLKLRSSIGVSGNAKIGNTAGRGLVNYGSEYTGKPGYVIGSIENGDLGWEKSQQWDIGFDFSMWKGRLKGTVDYYIRNTTGLLLEKPVPETNGVSTILSNVGRVRNQGIEFEFSTRVLTGAFDWTIGINGATLKNEILELIDRDSDGNQENIIIDGRLIFQVGQSMGTHFLVEYAGVDPTNGSALYYDLDGNKLVNEAPATNRKIVGKTIPSFTGGFSSSFGFMNFDLAVFFHFKTGYSIYMVDRNLETNMTWSDNQNRSQLNAWTPSNTDTDVPQVRLEVDGVPSNGIYTSTRYLKRGDYLRIQNLNFGYTIRAIGQKKASMRIFAAAQNLWTITRFPGLDPDVEMYPSEAATQGATRFNLPAARTFTFGFNIEF